MSTIKIASSPSEQQLNDLQVTSWPIWGSEVADFPWHYDANEECYLLTGKVVVTPEGGEPVTLQAGDLVSFPAGMACRWQVLEPVRKHYRFI